ncbi:hypothetical protein ACSX1A_11110 [Pontibacter sp. MBLB2868]|uniref:hypothetical protein n=1 Tax=Pontibacter sp. MBLB2868 TaxID=3451555 RepID=UPI003F74C688
MEKFDTLLQPLLTDSYIRYQAKETVKSMSVDYFKKSFKEAAGAVLPKEGQQLICYQSLENPDFILCFSLTDTASLSVVLRGSSDF